MVVIGSAVIIGGNPLPAPGEGTAATAAAVFLLRNALLTFFEGRVLRVELFVDALLVVVGFSATPPPVSVEAG
jgi:hypothetical protein